MLIKAINVNNKIKSVNKKKNAVKVNNKIKCAKRE